MSNPLPPLPLIDGCLFVDNSGWLEGLQSCHRLVEYKQLHRRIATGESAAINFGSAFHLFLEHRYRNHGVDEIKDKDKFINETSSILTRFFEDHPTPLEDWRGANWAMEMVKKYMERYPLEEFTLLHDKADKPLVELPFALPLYTHKSSLGEIPIIYTGRIDLPNAFDKEIWVTDHKTSSMLGQSFFDRMKRSAQQKGYCWSFEQLTGLKVTGYMINAIRTKEPPLYVQSGKKEGKFNPETWWNETFQREKYYLAPGSLEEWKQNTIEHIETFFYHYQRGILPESTTACVYFGKCPYFDICTLSKEDRGTMLYSGMFTNNVWSPLKNPSEVKA